MGFMAGPTVYFFVRFAEPVRHSMLGGPKVVVQQAEILNAHGIRARIVFRRRRPWPWRGDDLFIPEREFGRSLGPDDLVVVPGRLAHRLDRVPGRNKVILTQLVQQTLAGFPVEFDGAYPWHRDDVRAILTVSDHNAELMRLAAPGCPVLVTYNRIEIEDFPYRPWSEKKDLVAVNWPARERKNPRHTRMLLNLLRSRAAALDTPFGGWRIQVIENLSDAELRRTLAEARLLFFLSSDEGLGLLPLEALAAGTVVAGYDLGPLDEFLPAEYRREWADMAGLVELVEAVADPERAGEWERLTRQARPVAERYSKDRQVASVLEAYRGLLG